jgi:hypothetical protein
MSTVPLWKGKEFWGKLLDSRLIEDADCKVSTWGPTLPFPSSFFLKSKSYVQKMRFHGSSDILFEFDIIILTFLSI